jgi:hypothetical protein
MTKKQGANTRRKKKPDSKLGSKEPRRKGRALAQVPRSREEVRANIDPLLGDLPSVTLKNEGEVFFHFRRVDPHLAEAWRRDVVVHEGPITLRRVMSPASFGGATHYAYVDRRLLWYLKHDPTDPLGARWDGYLVSVGDAPPGPIAVVVGRDVVVKKHSPQLEDGDR